MFGRPLHTEVRVGFAGTSDLRTHTRVCRLQAVVCESRPVATNRSIKTITACRVDVVGNRVDPFDIGPEAGLSREIERQMNPQPARFRHRINQA